MTAPDVTTAVERVSQLADHYNRRAEIMARYADQCAASDDYKPVADADADREHETAAALRTILSELDRLSAALGEAREARLLDRIAEMQRQLAQADIDYDYLRHKLADAEVDAERYRFIRGRDPGPDGEPVPAGLFIGRVPENLIVTGDDADRAIDRARTALQQQEARDGLG